MEVCRRSSWLLLLLGVSLLATTLQGVQGEAELEGPSESECRPYIEKALKELETGDTAETETDAGSDSNTSIEDVPNVDEDANADSTDSGGDINEIHDEASENTESVENTENNTSAADNEQQEEEQQATETNEESIEETQQEVVADEEQAEASSTEQVADEESKSGEEAEATASSVEEEAQQEAEQQSEEQQQSKEEEQADEPAQEESAEATAAESVEQGDEAAKSEEESDKAQSSAEESVTGAESVETEQTAEESAEAQQAESAEGEQAASEEAADQQVASEEQAAEESSVEQAESVEQQEKEAESAETQQAESAETAAASQEEAEGGETKEVEEEATEDAPSAEEAQASKEETGEEQAASIEDAAASVEETKEESSEKQEEETAEEAKSAETEAVAKAIDEISSEDGAEPASVESSEPAPVEELSFDIEMPTELREREHVERLLKLDDEASEMEQIINRIAEVTLRELKRLYESAIKPLETLYKYRDLSNRHFGDSEIFSKPLILFMGPWSGGKSSIINYLLNNEYNETSLRTGAEPSPAYFNLLMHGDEPEVLDGTQLAADYTFAGLQKFGQGLEERLRGVKLPNKLLEKVNIVEIPGILEVRKQVSRVFPFNDACQWFIDRADIIFLVYDPSKLDVGPETEAILDQLKGREHQTRIILNKADQVKPEELMRVQGALIWNISPLMSSPQPPVMYTTSLWSRPYEVWAPSRLLQAQERAFLRDLRGAIDKRIDNKIASARRFAVRVRNHAKMVDCYLTTYYNHKSVFGNRKQVADEIIEHPQDYHIYEGLSTLTNISRYDLPDPEVYKDFFKLNPLYEFQQLSSTCTYFRGCPINRLDVAIAYDLPELVGKHKRLVENALAKINPTTEPGS